jgi:hypothetical protein
LPLAWLFFLLQYTTEINPSKIIGTLITAFRTANGKARFDTSKVAWNETKVAERKAMVMHALHALARPRAHTQMPFALTGQKR